MKMIFAGVSAPVFCFTRILQEQDSVFDVAMLFFTCKKEKNGE